MRLLTLLILSLCAVTARAGGANCRKENINFAAQEAYVSTLRSMKDPGTRDALSTAYAQLKTLKPSRMDQICDQHVADLELNTECKRGLRNFMLGISGVLIAICGG